jgi:anti-sigma B factor antagonist
VQSIDFFERAMAIQVDRVTASACLDHLRDFFGYCAYLGFSKIAVRHPADMNASPLATLRSVQGAADAPTVSVEPLAARRIDRTDSRPNDPGGRTGTAVEPCGFACSGRYDDSGSSVEYEFSCRDLYAVLDHLTTAVLIVGYSVPLDEDSLSRLRLCLYELATNTVEHGTFDHARPEIRVSLIVGEDCIVAKYSDNARAFSTLRGRRIDIGEKISRRAKRGLGLFLLNNITEGLSYERDSAWNRTSFIIHRDNNASCNPNRRKDMNELTVTVTPTDMRDCVVITPAGSINSSSVPQLDAALHRLIQSGKTLIVIDFSQTEFVSSSGVGLLLGTVSALRDNGGDMVLMKLPKLINDIFEVLNIKMHFRIIGDLSELKAGTRA